ncbi:MAG: hypothetical protein J7L45_03230 [Candidatus Aenigmarchaeota archaeon]|nr:hypothetical protein [Candidatus Aenigmarchaeota archaeon]
MVSIGVLRNVKDIFRRRSKSKDEPWDELVKEAEKATSPNFSNTGGNVNPLPSSEFSEPSKFKPMGAKEFSQYVKRLQTSSSARSQERGRKLASQYRRWFLKVKDKDTAAKKALASVQMATAREKIKEAESEGNVERASRWKKVLGHALTKHQEGQKYTTNIGVRPKEITPKDIERIAEGGEGPGEESTGEGNGGSEGTGSGSRFKGSLGRLRAKFSDYATKRRLKKIEKKEIEEEKEYAKDAEWKAFQMELKRTREEAKKESEILTIPKMKITDRTGHVWYERYKEVMNSLKGSDPDVAEEMAKRFRAYLGQGYSPEEAAKAVLEEMEKRPPKPKVTGELSPEGPGEPPGGKPSPPPGKGHGEEKPRCDLCGKETDDLRYVSTPQGILKVCPECYKKLQEAANKGKSGKEEEPKEEAFNQFDPRLKVDVPCPRCGSGEVYIKVDKNGKPIKGKLVCKTCGYEFSAPKRMLKKIKKPSGKIFSSIFHGALPTIILAIMIAFGIMMVFGTATGTIMLSAGIVLISMERLFDPVGSGGYVKSVFRTFGFILIGLGLYMHFHTVPLLKVVPLFVLAFELVTYPMPEKVVTPEQKGMQIMRVLLGIVLILVFYWTFIGLMAVSPYLFWSLILMSAAFFIAVPVSQSVGDATIDDAMNKMLKVGENIGEGIAKGLGKKAASFSLATIVKIIIFIVLFELVVKFALPMLGVPVSFSLKTPLGLLGAISNPSGLMDLLTGTMIGTLVLIAGLIHTANKPHDLNGLLLGMFGGSGIIAGSLALAGTTFAYFFFLIIASVGIIAAAPVVNARPIIGVPILFALIITATAAYPDVMGESVFGIWWPKIDYAISSITPTFEGMIAPFKSLQEGFQILSNPVAYYQNYQPQTSTKESIGAIEVTRVEPMGETTITMPSQKVMVLATIENRGKEYGKDITVKPIQPVYAHGTAEGRPAGSVKINCDGVYKSSCNIDLLLPGELRQYGIEYTIGEGKYLLRGNYISYGAQISYDYDVNGKVSVSVMDKDYYYKLAENGKLNKQEQVTEDSGGPVRLGIAVMRNEMPVRDDMGGVPVMIYLENQGRGTAKIKNAYIDISSLENNGKKVYCVAGSVEGADETKPLDGIKGKTIGPGESIKGYCYSKIPDIDVDQKTFQLTAKVDYTYTSKVEKKMNIDFGSFYSCECVKDNDKKYILVKSCNDCSDSLCDQLFSGYSLNQCVGKQGQ